MKRIFSFFEPFFPFLVVLGVYIFGSALDNTEFSTEGGMVKVRPGAKVYPDFGENPRSTTTYPAGDSVQFLGYYNDKFSSSCLVKTEKGFIGDIPLWELEIPLLASRGKYKGDTIRLIPPKQFEEYKGYPIIPRKTEVNGILPNGEKTENLWSGNFFPDVPHFIDLKISEGINKSFTKLMSKEKFDGLLSSLKYGSAESVLGPVLASAQKGNNEIRASYHALIFNPESGKFFRPVITFNSDSAASSVELVMERERADWLLKNLPGAAKIYDWPLTTFFARSDLYLDLNRAPGLMSGLEQVWFWIRYVVKFLGVIIWFFCFSYPAIWILNYIIVNFPGVFRPFSNSVMKAIYIAVIALLTYYWILVTLAWGMYWFFIPVQILIAGSIYYQFNGVLSEFIPHARCPQCKHVHSMILTKSELLDSYLDTEYINKTQKTGTDVKEWETYTEVRYNSGRTERENVKRHKETTTHFKHDNFKDLVKKYLYHYHFACSNCGYKESVKRLERTLLDREHLDSSTSSETEYTVR